MSNFKVKRTASKTPPILVHHGIKGQRWGKRNGPPYPLDYEDHSAAEKKANSRSELTGDKKTDKKIVKRTYEEATYAKAASMLSRSQADRLKTKALKRDKKVGKDSKFEKADSENKRLFEQSQKAEENSKYFAAKFQRQAKEYADMYGKDSFKKFSTDKIDKMSLQKASNWIANNSIAGWEVLGGPVAGGIKGYKNYKNYRNYVDSL